MKDLGGAILPGLQGESNRLVHRKGSSVNVQNENCTVTFPL